MLEATLLPVKFTIDKIYTYKVTKYTTSSITEKIFYILGWKIHKNKILQIDPWFPIKILTKFCVNLSQHFIRQKFNKLLWRQRAVCGLSPTVNKVILEVSKNRNKSTGYKKEPRNTSIYMKMCKHVCPSWHYRTEGNGALIIIHF